MGKRVISAFVMLIIFIPLLIIGGNVFTIFISLLGVLGLYELFKLRKVIKIFQLL